ncbi:MAG: dTDP-4-dehydrorhamnose reductase [Chitinispirillaceae bacterium]|nr:dTDP-4-dehydrorhamnose reductase [Chitinispirillaceae bacterium]
MNKRRMLIIGSTGQLGTDMCREARSAGYQVTGVDFPQIDIAERRSVARHVVESKAAYIINCAAYTAVDDCETNRERAFALNADGPGSIAAAAASIGARMVHISTDYVFDGRKTGPYLETDFPNPQSVYGQSKYAGEQQVAAACENHQIFRIAWLYGLHGKNFVFTIRAAAEKKAASGGPLTVVNDQFGTPTSTREVCRQVLKALPADLTGIFHATCEGSCTWFDFAKEIILAAARIPVEVLPCTTDEFPRPAPRPKNSMLENQRLKRAGIAVMTGWKRAFREFLRDEADLREEMCTK